MAAEITVEQFEELYRNTGPELFAYVQRRTPTDAEDVVAEVFVVAWRRRSDLPPAMLRRAWLYGIARRILLAQTRTRSGERRAVELAARAGGDNASRACNSNPPPGDDGTTVEVLVAHALERLRPAERELLQLVEWEGMTPTEVAIVLGLRPGTVRVRLHRARQALAADQTIKDLVGGKRAERDSMPVIVQ